MAPKVKLTVTQQLRQWLKEIGGRYSVQIDGLTGPSRTKLDALIENDRNFTKVTPALKTAIVQEWRRNAGKLLSKSGKSINMDPALEQMARTAKAIVLRRFDEGGFDVRLRALSAAWLETKRRHGWDLRIGIAKGVLLRNMQLARFVMRKVGKSR